MQQRLQDNYVLSQLISTFESQEEGINAYFEDKELLQMIAYYEEAMDYERALEVAEQGLTHFSFNSEFFISKARVLARMQAYPEALHVTQEGLAVSPGEHELELLRVFSLTELGELDAAMTIIDDRLQQAKGDDRVDLLVCQAHIFEKRKDFEAMFNALKKALIINPNETKAVEKIWVAVESIKNYKESVLLHKYIIDRNPYNHLAWYNLGHAYACLGDYPESIMSFEYSFLIDANYEAGYKDCADMCFQIGKFKQALSIYLDAHRQFGPDMEILVNIGRCYIELNDPAEAAKYLKMATKIDRYDDEAHYYLGVGYFQQGRFEQAIASFVEAIKLDDHREEYYADLAKAYHLTGEYSLANYYFHRATQIGPEEMTYWFHHIVFLFDIGAIDAAADVLDDAEFHTYGPEILYVRAALAFQRKNRKEGMKFLTEAIDECPMSVESFYAVFPDAKKDESIRSLIDYYLAEK